MRRSACDDIGYDHEWAHDKFINRSARIAHGKVGKFGTGKRGVFGGRFWKSDF